MEELLERLEVLISVLESATERLQVREASMAAAADESVGQIVATVEGTREAELAECLQVREAQLAQAEERIAELMAAAQVATTAPGRKTSSAGVIATLAKQGVAAGALEGLEAGRFEAGALDTALASLSIEQRFAVKAEMLRAGLLG